VSDALVERLARLLAQHSGWATTGPDVNGVMEVECFDCGVALGDDHLLIDAWEERTGNSHGEWAKRGAVPAFDEALARHQAQQILIERFFEEA
jgi:hypothetical protein